MPEIPDWYIIPQEVVEICRHAKETTGKSMQMRNFLLRGPAGTGKTMGAKAIAAGMHLPYMKYTCSAGTEIFDFVGMIFPDSDSGSTGDATLDKELATLRSMGGMTYENVAKLIGQIENARGVPSLDTLVKISGALGVTVDQLLKENYVNPEMVYLKEISERIAAYSARQRIMACESLLNYLDSLEKFNQ